MMFSSAVATGTTVEAVGKVENDGRRRRMAIATAVQMPAIREPLDDQGIICFMVEDPFPYRLIRAFLWMYRERIQNNVHALLSPIRLNGIRTGFTLVHLSRVPLAPCERRASEVLPRPAANAGGLCYTMQQKAHQPVY
jgi:hypothetical protein